MVQVIQSNRQKPPSFLQSVMGGLAQGVPEGIDKYHSLKQQQQTQRAISERFGQEIANLPPELQKVAVSELLKNEGKSSLLNQKNNLLGNLFQGNQQKKPSFGDQINNESVPSLGNFDAKQLSDEQIAQATALDPNIGRSLQHAKDVALRDKRSQEKLEFEKEKASPEHQREQRLASAQAEADVKYNQSLQESAKLNELKEKTLERLEKLNNKGVTGKPYEKLLEKSGLVNLTSDGRREFAADVKNLITDIRSILGSQFSSFEFATILNAYPSADFSQGANKAIIDNLKEFQDIKKKEFEYATELKKESKGKLPEDFQSKVNDKVHEYAASRLDKIKANTQKIWAEEYGITPGNILMLDPQGVPLDVPSVDVERYQELEQLYHDT